MGATRVALLIPQQQTSFNPRARDGRDPPQGMCWRPRQRFNPRARDGRDSSMLLASLQQ